MKSFKLNEDALKLENEFFLKEDQKLIEELRRLKKMKETQESLSQASGITNEKVLKKLVELDIHPEIVAALAVVPLVEVAWADGKVDNKEKEALLSAADSKGIRTESIEHQLLKRWLEHKPKPALLDAWTHYIQGLCESLNSQETELLKRELLHHSDSVAQASGGFLGLGGKISAQESEIIRKLESVFP